MVDISSLQNSKYKKHCIFCKSIYHDYRNCPVAYKLAAQKKSNKQFKKDYHGESPNIFVGHYGYPKVNVGFLNTEQYDEHDDPQSWANKNKKIPEIIGKRTELVNSHFSSNVKLGQNLSVNKVNDKLLDLSKEVSMAKSPAAMELNLEKAPVFKLTFEQDAKPHGASVAVKKAQITENTNIDPRVEKVVDDDLKATQGINKLYKQKQDVYFLTKLLTVGNLGLQKNRRLVPTRWGITATDDAIGKQLIKEIKDFNESNLELHFGGYLGNYYLVLFFDDVFSYELFEGYLPVIKNDVMRWETDYENYHGRKYYVEETAGGYYASRISVLEKLKEQKKQASILVLRFITEEYTAPLGVWVVREAVKKAMQSHPIKFSSREEMLNYAKQFCIDKFDYDIDPLLARSKLLSNVKKQVKLSNFF